MLTTVSSRTPSNEFGFKFTFKNSCVVDAMNVVMAGCSGHQDRQTRGRMHEAVVSISPGLKSTYDRLATTPNA